MASIAGHGSPRMISRSNSSSSQGRNNPLQGVSTLHLPIQLHRESLVQKQDTSANMEQIEDGNETQPSLSSLRAPPNPNSIQEDKDARFTSLRRAIHWKTVGMIIGFLFIAMLSALGHYLLFLHLDRKLTNASYLTQQRTSGISILLTTLFKATLTASVGICFTQHLWFILRGNAISLSTVEKLFVFRTNLLALGDLRSIWRAPLLFLMALLIWCSGIAMIYPPGALIVVLAASDYVENRNMSVMNPPVPQELNLGGNDTFPGLGVQGFETFTFPNGSSERTWSYGYWSPALFNIAKSVVVYGRVFSMPGYPGDNSTYNLQFRGPQLRCTRSIHYNNTFSIEYHDPGVFRDSATLIAPAMISKWDPYSRWEEASRDAPFYSFAKHSTEKYTVQRTLNNVTSVEGLRTTAEQTCKPYSVLYDVKVSYPRGIQTIQHTTSDTKILASMLDYTGLRPNLRELNMTASQFNVSESEFENLNLPVTGLRLPADAQTLQNWNSRMRTVLPLAVEWALVDALAAVLEDSAYERIDSFSVNQCEESGVSPNGTTFFDCGNWTASYVQNFNTSSLLKGSVFDTSRTETDWDQIPFSWDYLDLQQDLLNDVLRNITFSAISLETWWDMIPVTSTRYQSTYSFAHPLSIIIPYSVCLATATLFAAIAVWSLWRNGMPAEDNSFLQVMMATRGNTEMERLVLDEKVMAVDSMSKELRNLEVRYGELIGEDICGVERRRLGFGTVEETVSLRRRK